ncbi:lactosylceramide 4-alpha-galactosyltransferase-like [Centruroides sculpturatus]|uniref:lactosylceramide 4-alpha-galactosyltransferase-like n=1 Tax=Centruroides sculpturatus TaxID=218467 RepID=UPI000C6D5DCD|nr:lactosylceramide 4-alpha-galactosyltransferase-like [Centruroides sculpturatus]
MLFLLLITYLLYRNENVYKIHRVVSSLLQHIHGQSVLRKVDSANIFFVETSGSSSLNVRQACAIESTARHHLSASVNVLIFTENNIPDIFNLTRNYTNIQLIKSTFQEIFRDTPLLKWYERKEWNKSEHKVIHLSDAARYALIWKYGGIYLDLDIVMLKSMSFLGNFVIKEHGASLGNSIFGIKDHHHPFLLNCMNEASKEYRTNFFACIGPPFFTRIFTSYCNGSNLNDLQKRNDCDFTILNPKAAFPLFYGRWEDYFSNSLAKTVLREIKDSYLIHVWNKLSSTKILHAGSGSAYELTMANNCPFVYEQAVKLGTF